MHNNSYKAGNDEQLLDLGCYLQERNVLFGFALDAGELKTDEVAFQINGDKED